MKVKFKKLHPAATAPVYATKGAAAFDIRCVGVPSRHPVFIGQQKTFTFNTGLSFEIPAGHVMLVFSRSGHGFKEDLRLANCVGVIDSDYRGEVKVKLTRDKSNPAPSMIKDGDRIAQAIILPIPQIEFEEAEDLSETERGDNGFGSTGQ